MEKRIVFTLYKKKVFLKWSEFRRSILFYPISSSVIVLIMFLITSRIDENLDTKISIDFPYFPSLIFSGSADAARSTLSTIAAGWATILGVAFSVSLITLQLSTSRYTSYLVNKFEEDRINKLTLSWFISVVLYSLLVLKTVRTESALGDVFIPTIGVNVSVALASAGLFIFVVFLYNISSYLKPKVLISKLVNQIIYSIKRYQERDLVDSSLLDMKVGITSEQKNVKLFLKLNSTEEGVISYIDWDSLCSSIKHFMKNSNYNLLAIEFYKTLGDIVHEGDVLTITYGVISNSNQSIQGESSINNSVNDNNRNHDKKHQKLIENLERNFFSSVHINMDRDFHRDPVFGIELLRNFAIKSASNSDLDLTIACVSGLFKILLYVWRNQDKSGLPFKLELESNTKTKQTEVEHDPKDSSFKPSKRENIQSNMVIINPNEVPLDDTIFSELSTINHNATKQNIIPVIKQLTKEYVTSSKTLLDNGNKDKFNLLTEWYSQQLIFSGKSLPKEFRDELSVKPLRDLQNYLSKNHDYARSSFDIHMKNLLNDST